MDRKSQARRRRSRRTPSSRMRTPVPLLGLPGTQTLRITCRYNYGLLSSGTTGVLSAADLSPTIANMTEYSTLSSLFSEVRLLGATIIFTNACTSASQNGRIVIGTQCQASYASHATPPLTASQVENLAQVRYLNLGYSVFDRPYIYQMVVPRNLEFASISADSPSPATPWAGSPGCVYVWGSNLSASFQYLNVDIIATYELRARV